MTTATSSVPFPSALHPTLRAGRVAATTLLLASLLLGAPGAAAPQSVVEVDDSDISLFWEAYDRIADEPDRSRRVQLLDSLYLRRASRGLEAMIARRGLTPESFVTAIESYPVFWRAVRPLMSRSAEMSGEIRTALGRLQELYPALGAGRIYFTVGALMTAGQVSDGVAYIGSELALADSTVPTDEMPAGLGRNLRAYFDGNPAEAVAFLNVHEYVHTQQSAFGGTLLAVAVQEGVAEYAAELAAEHPSPTPAIAFGRENDRDVATRFAAEMMSPNTNDWLYNNFQNEFGIRDLGYYVGYAIVRRYHEQSDDRAAALAELIELEYANPDALHPIVDASGYFDQSVEEITRAYRAAQPQVVSITPANGSAGLTPGRIPLAIEFSMPMSPRFRGFDYGPLGEEAAMRIQNVIGWSEDQRTLTVEVELLPDRLHQMTLTSQFRTADGPAIDPYVIEFDTRARD